MSSESLSRGLGLFESMVGGQRYSRRGQAVRAPIVAIADAMALARLGEDQRAAFGSVRLWMSAGFAVGAITFGFLIDAVGLGVVAPLYAGFCALNASLLALVLHRRSPPRWPRRARAGPRRVRTSPAKLVPLALMVFALFLTNAAYSATYSFVAVRIAALGGGATFVGLAAGFQAGAEAPSMAWTKRLARRLHPSSLFIAGAGIYVAVYIVWAVVASAAALAALRLIAGVGFGLTCVATVLLSDEIVPAHLRATGQAASRAVMFGLAPVVGSLGGGLVYGYFGPAPFFLLAAAATAFAAFIIHWAQVSSDRSDAGSA